MWDTSSVKPPDGLEVGTTGEAGAGMIITGGGSRTGCSAGTARTAPGWTPPCTARTTRLTLTFPAAGTGGTTWPWWGSASATPGVGGTTGNSSASSASSQVSRLTSHICFFRSD